MTQRKLPDLERDRKCVYNDLEVNVKVDFVLRLTVHLEITWPALLIVEIAVKFKR